MQRQRLLTMSSSVILVGFMVSILSGCGTESNIENPIQSSSGSDGNVEITAESINISMIYCSDLGYSVETKTNANGNYGACVFPDGSDCELWSFYWGSCGNSFSYCEQNGYSLSHRIDDAGAWMSEYGVCVFDDGSECLEQAYLDNRCLPGRCTSWVMSQGGCIQ